MKKILIATILMLLSLGVCLTSFAVNDINALNTWYVTNLPQIDQNHHSDKVKKDKNHDIQHIDAQKDNK